MFNTFLKKALPILLFLSLWQLSAFAQQQDSLKKQGLFDLMYAEKQADITLVLNIDSLMAKVKTNEYFDGEFHFTDAKNQGHTLPVKIRPRGRFRRMKCNFPPLKLKFKKEDLSAQGLNKFNEFKLVTHCLNDETVSKEMIMREYLIYKLYNQLTPYSFRVQLVNVTYQHEQKESEKFTRWGILIEDSDNLARRNKSKIVSRMGIPLDSLHAGQEKIASTFQYMIGNCDWSYIMARNTEFIQLNDGQIVPVPYDFDYSGLVNAPYARYDPSLGQTSVRDRIYMGFAPSAKDLKSTFSHYKTQKKALFKKINDFPFLSSEVKKDMRQYLQGFYATIENDDQFEATFLARKKRK
jgi:hypothetical protein